MAVGFVALGAILWKPLPLEISENVDYILLTLGSLAHFPAIGLYLWGLATLGKEFGVSTSAGADVYADHRLIREGPFGYVRHPMYLAVLLAALGALMIFRTWAMVVFFPMSLTVIRRAEKEEEVLAETFGEAWQDYVTEVPKWLPRWQGKGRGKGAR